MELSISFTNIVNKTIVAHRFLPRGASKQRSDSCMMRSMHRLMTVSRVIAILTRHCPAAMSPFSSFTMAVPMASPMFMSEKTRDSSPL